MTKPPEDVKGLSSLMSPQARELLTANGNSLMQHIGMDVVRGVVYDVLSGRNLRDSTEALTRRRLATLNLAMVGMFMKGSTISPKFVEDLPALASQILQHKAISKSERWLAQWVLGLTDKAFQNVLRDNPQALSEYRDQYVAICQQVIAECEAEQGRLSGTLALDSATRSQVDWLFLAYLLNAIGAQTLAIRGSEKSAYGKLFEKLVLGSLLHILGFKYVSEEHPEPFRRVFWLSSREKRRESDATLLYEAGKGVRFDIGFIGRGNPEISLDKVSRFEREVAIGRSQWYMATIIIVDRIGANSRIEQLAKEVGGTIVQMSLAYWPQQVAHELSRVLGYEHPLTKMEQSEISAYLRTRLYEVPLEDFLGNAR